jgi:predicted  nucleic acid-binding Zn-ribbon protein
VDQSFVSSLPVWGWIVAALVALFLVTRLAWWLFHAALLGNETAETVRTNSPFWRAKAAGWMGTLPNISVNGFFCAILWPVTVGLNLLLLAQVLEMVFPGGGRVEIPNMGSYTYLSLLAGALYSISQTLFGVGAEQAGKARKALASLFILLLLATIVGEMGLAYYRATELLKGVDALAPTVVDQTFSKGVVLTVFLSFIVPVAHSILGFVALPNFFGPIVGYVPRFLAGIVLYAWAVFARFFFGFQNVRIVPEAISEIRRQSRIAAETGKGLAAAIAEKNAVADRGRQIEKQWKDMGEEGTRIAQDSSGMQGNWQKESQAIADSIRGAESQDDFTRIGQRIAELQAKAKSEPQRNFQEADRLIARIGKLRNGLEERRAELKGLPAAVPSLKVSLKHALDTVERVERDLAHLRRILDPATGQPKEPGSNAILATELPKEPRLNPADAELGIIFDDAMIFANPRKQRDASALHAICMKALNDVEGELNRTRAALTPCSEQIDVLETKVKELESQPPVFPSLADLTASEEKLRQAQMGSMAAMRTIVVLLRPVQILFKEKASAAGRVPAGPKKKFWLVRMFGWIGQKWSGFVDVIVGGKPEPKPEPETDSAPAAKARAAAAVEIPAALPPASPESGAKE